MGTKVINTSGTHANEANSLDYSRAEMIVKNIVIPGSQFHAKWEEEKGYAIGYENIKLTKNYETLEKALNQIGYGVEKDKDGDEILVKNGDVDYELIVRIIKAVNIIEAENIVNAMEGGIQNG